MGAVDEDVLISGCIEWDRHAQNTLYKLYAPKMYPVCLRYSANKEEAEDTLLEGFMKVFEKINSFRKDGPLEAWIRRIMVNTAIEKFRKRKIEDSTIVREDGKEVSNSRTSKENI